MVTLYVEGGGDSPELKADCRKGFRQFCEQAGLEQQPRVLAMGPRGVACKFYGKALQKGQDAMLLVDSEG